MKTKQSVSEAKLSKLWLLPLVILLSVPVWLFWPRERPPELTIVTETMPAAAEETAVETFHSVLTVDAREHFPVYLTGAVYLPGLYYVPDGTILADVVADAGGLREEAASEHINLAMRLLAHQMFYIPTRDELVENPQLAALVQPLPGTPDGKVNINTADEPLLITLPGIGPATARAIIRYRESNGPFEKTADLMKVAGIKKTKYEGLEMYITAP